ncbi:MAG: metalloregulator ArsR/SmtB family transcription factor [Planctomycetota bacterium]
MANRQPRNRSTAVRSRGRHRDEAPAEDERLDRTFAALSDPTRRAILAQLAEEDALPAGRLAEGFDMAWPSVSKHLRVLEGAGLLRQEKDGRVRRCHLEAEPLKEAAAWIAYYQQFWGDRLDALADFLETDD